MSILHYLERIYWGEMNLEDRTVRPSAFADVTTTLKKEQQMLYDTLCSVLRREKMETLGALIRAHGVGSIGPSPFALDLLSRLQLK